MQEILKKCDFCKAEETLEKTLEDPKPDTSFKTMKIPGYDRKMPGLEMDLCKDHYLTFLEMSRRWVMKQPALDEFFPKVA